MRAVLASFSRAPVKLTLTLLTVGLGVGVLIFALSISSAFSRYLERSLEKNGVIVMIMNATLSESTGQMEPVRPSQLDEKVLDVLKSDVPGVVAAAPISEQGFNELTAGTSVYRLRTVTQSDDEYAALMGLDVVAGSFFTADDVTNGAKKAVISASLAEILFGSVEGALGQTLKPPAPVTTTTTGSGGSSTSAASTSAGSTSAAASQAAPTPPRAFVMPTYTIVGVFEDVTELQRTAYGVADMIIPYTANLPQGMNTQMARRFAMSTIAVRAQGVSVETLESQIRAALSGRYGSDVKLQIWEGTPRGETATIKEARETVSAFSLVVNLLGFILLVTGSIGILSIMLVEVLGRSRQIAIERALGASGRVIVGEYFTRSLILAALSAVAGAALALALGEPLRQLVLPIFNGVNEADLGAGVITPAAVAIGIGSALLVGGVFGVFPVIPALHANIAEGMRET